MYTSVAQQGGAESPEALYRLGMMHYNGENGVVDKIKAKALWRRAALQGHRQAQNLLQALEKGPADQDSQSGPAGVGAGGGNWTYERF